MSYMGVGDNVDVSSEE